MRLLENVLLTPMDLGSSFLILDQHSISRRLFLCSDTYCSLKNFLDLAFQRLFYNSYYLCCVTASELCIFVSIKMQVLTEDSVSTEQKAFTELKSKGKNLSH